MRLKLVIAILVGASGAVGGGFAMFRYVATQEHGGASDDREEAMLYCSRRVIDLGKKYRPVSQKVPLRYLIENRSNRPLSLRVVKRTCACAAASLTRTEVRPGESTELQVVWELPNALGESNMRVYVADVNVEGALIALGGVVETSDVVRVEPYEVSLGELSPNTTLPVEISIYASAGKQLSPHLRAAITGDSHSSCKIDAVKRLGAKAVVRMSVTGTGTGQNDYADMVIHTGEEVQPEITVPIRLTHTARYSARPGTLTYDSTRLDDKVRLLVIVSNVPGQQVRVTRVAFDEPACFSAVMTDIKDGAQGCRVELLKPPQSQVSGMRVYVDGWDRPVVVTCLSLGSRDGHSAINSARPP